MLVPEPLDAYGRRDVVIIGAGVIGLVTAWRALQRGLTVTLVDPEPAFTSDRFDKRARA